MPTRAAVDKSDPDLLNHICGLGLHSVEDYQDWCACHGFSRKLRKHWKQRCRERSFSQQEIAQERLDRQKREKRSYPEVLDAVCHGRLKENDVALPHLKQLCSVLQSARGPKHEAQTDRTVLNRLLKHLHSRRAKFFDGTPVIASLGQLPGNTYIEALTLLAAHHKSWRRPVTKWKPQSHSAPRQFGSLLRHLLVAYDMPPFMDSVWLSGRGRQAAERRRWYLHVGRGQNIRHCQLPVKCTKKMAHWFMRVPADATVDQALRWAQVHSMGGDARLAQAIFGTRLAETFRHEEFWETVIRWVIRHPMLDRRHVGPIVDYLHHQRFVPEQVFVTAGVREAAAPTQPNLTMRDRLPEVLLRQVNEWHRALARDNRHQVQEWKPQPIEDFEFVEGASKGRNLRIWTIRELRSSRSLLTEGRRMNHCVGSYQWSCSQGYSSIWAMECESFEGIRKVVTIEVRNPTKTICQVRGKSNRLPTQDELRLIRRWADNAGLSMGVLV